MKIESIPLDNLILDKNNPRHPPSSNQREILEYFASQKETRKLAEDICKNGLNPAIWPIVVDLGKDEFVVIDGNRRIAALKLLDDPDLAGNKYRSFQNMASNWDDKIEEIKCIVAKSRDEAWPWVVRLHSGKMEGIGQTPWDAAQKARAFPDSYPVASSVLNTVMPNFSPEYPISTLDRILAGGKDLLGISLRETGIEMPFDQHRPIIETIVKEVEEKKSEDGSVIDSRSMRKKDEIESYIQRVAERKGVKLDPGGSKKLLPRPLGSGAKQKTRASSRPDPLKRKTLIPTSFPIRARKTKVYQLVKELRRINVDKYPCAAGLLLRALIANSCFALLENADTVDRRDSDRRIIEKAVDLLKKKGSITDAQAKPMRRYVSDSDASVSHDSLAAMGHNPYSASYPRDLKMFWDEIDSVMKQVLDAI